MFGKISLKEESEGEEATKEMIAQATTNKLPLEHLFFVSIY